MPVNVACGCGQRFAAQDKLYGRQVKCPACGSPLTIPNPLAAKPTQAAPVPQPAQAPPRPAPAKAAAATGPGVRVACACGKAFLAPETLRGKSVRCPSCGGGIQIPAAAGNDLLDLDPQLAMGAGPLAAAATSPLMAAAPSNRPQPAAGVPAGGNNPWLIVAIAGGAGTVVLVVLVAVIAISLNKPQVAQVPAGPAPPIGASSPATPPTASQPPRAPSSAPAPPPVSSSTSTASSPSATPTTLTASSPSTTSATPLQPMGTAGTGTTASSATPSSSGATATALSDASKQSAFRDNTPASGTGVTFLPTAVHSWHEGSGRRTGIQRAGDSEVPYGHFSWMTQLLPFIGHQKEYDQINFSQALSDRQNIVVGATVIPAFLNPLDDRKAWKGYPFQGLALTHFAGMAGVEDARNVVAATLPRDDPRAGVFGYDEVARPQQITDGTANTIMVVGTGALANPWILGGGSTIRGAREPYFDQVSGLGTRNLPQPGTIAVMADGSVRFISASVDPQVFRAMCTTHGSDSVDLERAAQPFLLESIEK